MHYHENLKEPLNLINQILFKIYEQSHVKVTYKKIAPLILISVQVLSHITYMSFTLKLHDQLIRTYRVC